MEALLTGNIIFGLSLLAAVCKWVYSIDKRLARLETQLQLICQTLETRNG